jgi:hypothetical protein
MMTRPLPEADAVPAGYAYLIDHYGLDAPAPFILSAIGKKHKNYETGEWRVFTPRHAPKSSLYGQLTFALRYEGIDLSVLNALFRKIKSAEIQSIINKEKPGIYVRRIWFLFEFLTEHQLNPPKIDKRSYVDLLDPRLQYPGPSRPSKRHGVNNNLPGVKGFCPLIRRTKTLDKFIHQDLPKEAQKSVDAIHPDVLMRAASFLLLEDSKASFAIEGEAPPHNRAERWGRIIGLAGKTPLSKAGFEELQKEVLENSRFVKMGLRKEGGFIGTHDRSNTLPLPSHISARHEDLDDLIDSLIETASILKDSDYPPVLTAALIAFGFVFIHPFEDGNGRLHRYLLHHVLAETGFTPEGLVFPVSAAILKRITEYRTVLEAYSKPRLPFVDWRPTDKGNVEVLNETADLFRFFDATHQAEFLYECVDETISKTLPEEVKYLQRHDEMKAFVNNVIDMPDHKTELLIRFLDQNRGTLSKRKREKEFSALTDEETRIFEDKFAEIFEI